eukprot:TRINITY_DN4843_c0_g1_i2.p3 TRINITY_DN4843_c0_g1~~TRINITY_DN4843_c0_g1_i2.p3  ORF type:complete len:238 (-),score=30.65 TRINITY_DN4843_c0_g1_i2:2090-2803(-)
MISNVFQLKSSTKANIIFKPVLSQRVRRIRIAVQPHSQQERWRSYERDSRRESSSFRGNKKRRKQDFEFRYGDYEFRANRDDLGSFLLPSLGVLLLLSLVGPILAVAAGTVVMAGLAVTVGVSSLLFFAGVLPLIFAFGGGAFFLGPLLFAGLGIFGLIIKGAILLGSLALGTQIAQNFFFKRNDKVKKVEDRLQQYENEFETEMRNKQLEIDRELKEFDDMMRRRESSYEKWKRNY